MSSTDPASVLALLRFYSVSVGSLVPPVPAGFEGRVRPDGSGFGCVHLVPTGDVAMAPRHVDRCEACTADLRAFTGSPSWVALDAASSLAHWSRWLSITRSPSAAVVLAGVIGNVRSLEVPVSGHDLADDVVADVSALLERADELVRQVGPAFEPDVWTLAGSMSGALEGALTWMYAASSGATAQQCQWALSWAGFPPLAARAGSRVPGGVRGEDLQPAGGFLLSDPRALGQWVDWCEPTLYQRLVIALDLPPRRVLLALPDSLASALSEVLRVALDRYRLMLVPASDLDARVPVQVSDEVARAASRLWQAAGPAARSSARVSFMASPVDCIEAACVLAAADALDSTVFDTALALAPAWFSPGRDLALAVLALD